MRNKIPLLRVLVVALTAATLPSTSPSARHLNTGPGTIWVTERTSGSSTVAAIDAATGESLGITPVGNLPIGITAPVGTNKVYSSDEGADQVSVIDRTTVTVLAAIPMGAGSKPHHLMASRNGRYVYVALFGTNTVGVIDTRADEKVASLVVSFHADAKTHAVWITPNGRYLYATNERPSNPTQGTFSKFDIAGGTLIWEHVVGTRPSEVLVDNDVAYVSVRNENLIKAYDVGGAAPHQIGQAEANVMPDTLSLTNDKRTLIVGLRGTPARMAFIDTEGFMGTVTVIPHYVALPGATTGHQWLSSNGHLTYIALERPGQIGVIDNQRHTVVTTYPYPNGMTLPHGVYFEQSPLEANRGTRQPVFLNH
jgi:YVTN family beta-propeller protein